LHNWHERRISTDCGQRNRSGASHLSTFVLRMLAAGTMLAALVQPEAAECVGTKLETCPHTCAFSLLPGHQAPLTNVLMPTRRRAAGGIRRR
jgi:hypothetical protein